MLKDSTTQEERGVRMSKKRYEIVSYDIPLWLKPVLSVTETSIYTGISANKIYVRIGGLPFCDMDRKSQGNQEKIL